MDKARYRYLSDGFEVKEVERTGNESQGREGVDNLRAKKEKEGDRPDTNTGVERLEKVNPKWRKKERKKDIKKGFMSAARAQD